MDLVEYHYTYFDKMSAMKNVNKIEYETSSDQFLTLSERGNALASVPFSRYSTWPAKLLIEAGHLEKNLLNDCYQFFYKSLCDQQYGGLYYLAELENNYFHNLKKEEVFELLCWAASLGHPLAHFKVALM